MFQGWQRLLRENDDAPDDDDDYGSHDSRGAGIGKPGNHPTGSLLKFGIIRKLFFEDFAFSNGQTNMSSN